MAVVTRYLLFIPLICLAKISNNHPNAMPKLGQPSTIGNFTQGEKYEIARVMALTDRQVRRELKDIMRGIGYS
jgi:hypothetical protein